MPYCVRTENKYDYIKSLIVRKKVYAAQLERIKLTFKDIIASPRRYGSIYSIADLITCLEGIDTLSEYNVDQLCQISEHFADDEIFMALEKYEEPVQENDVNIYALERTRERLSKIEIKNDSKAPKVVQQQSTPMPELTYIKCEALKKVVAREIGRKWRQFGRELDVRAGDLDNIERKHITDLESRVYDIFDIFEQNPCYGQKQYFYKICEALDNCKRKDLRKNIEQIMLNDNLS